MSRYIDADALINELKSDIAYTDYEWSMYADGFIETINDAPTIDAVSVVRCKECKRYNFYRKQFSMERRGDGLCDRMNCVMNDDDFCNYGEVRDE